MPAAGAPATAQTPTSYTVAHGIPNGSVQYTAPDGQKFYAPSSANFCAEEAAGNTNGMNPFAMNQAIGQGGQFDYQRDNGSFYPAYTDASNFGVGVYMYGAGFSESEMNAIGNSYSFLFSSNKNAASQATWWANGWKAAASGSLGCGCGK
jgi:hypothetical protein